MTIAMDLTPFMCSVYQSVQLAASGGETLQMLVRYGLLTNEMGEQFEHNKRITGYCQWMPYM